MMRYQQLDTAVESLSRKLPKTEVAIDLTKCKTDQENDNKLCKDCSVTNKYNLAEMIKKEEHRRLQKNCDFKPSLQRLPLDIKKLKAIKAELEVEDVVSGSKDIEVLKKIQQIRDLIEMTKQQEPQTPREMELYKKSELAKTKYLNALTNMQQRLKDIEYKYFTLPSIISKTIKTFNKSSKDISISADNCKSCKKKVMLQDNTPRITVKDHPALQQKISSQIQKKVPKEESKEDFDYADEFFPKREAALPPTLFSKNVPDPSGKYKSANSSPNDALSKKEKTMLDVQKDIKPYKYSKDVEMILKSNPTFPKCDDSKEKKSDKSYLFKKNHEIFLTPKSGLNKHEKSNVDMNDNKTYKVTKNIEMLFSKDIQNELFPNKGNQKVSPLTLQKAGNIGIPSKKNYAPPPFIQKIRHPELFPKSPLRQTQIKYNTPQTTPPTTAQSLKDSEKLANKHASLIATKPSISTKQEVTKTDSFKPTKRTNNLTFSNTIEKKDLIPADKTKQRKTISEIKDHAVPKTPVTSILKPSKHQDTSQPEANRKQRYSEQLWLKNTVQKPILKSNDSRPKTK